jgi:hypothetical protein
MRLNFGKKSNFGRKWGISLARQAMHGNAWLQSDLQEKKHLGRRRLHEDVIMHRQAGDKHTKMCYTNYVKCINVVNFVWAQNSVLQWNNGTTILQCHHFLPTTVNPVTVKISDSTRVYPMKYSMGLFCNGSFYNDSLLWPLSRTEHSWIVVHHCRNSSILSVLSALLALFQCARDSSFSILLQFF